MLRALWIFLSVALLCAAAVWLADNPGDLLLHWRGYEIRTSFVVGILLLVGVSLAVLFAYRLALGLVQTPSRLSAFMELRRRRRGFLALSRGMVAVAAGDLMEARRHSSRARRLLDDMPLTLLLSAQAAQLEGREEAATEHFEAMLKSSETELLGLRGLFVQARRAGDRVRALDIARRAFSLRPDTRWAGQAVFEIETAAQDWEAALATLDRAQSAKLMPREESRRKRLVLLTAKGFELEEEAKSLSADAGRSLRDRALSHASQALALDRHFVPALALAARLYGRTGRMRKGARLIEDAWEIVPHPDLADAYMNLAEDESAYDRSKRVQLLAGRNRNHVESRVALARASIAARDFLAARGALASYVAADAPERPTQRICELMAAIEEGEHGNRGSAREWLSRALHAPEDAAWTGESYRSALWSAVNPVTGEFDALEWKATAPRLVHVTPLPSTSLPDTETEKESAEERNPPVFPQPGSISESRTSAEEFAFPFVAPDDPGPDDPGLEDKKEETKW